MTSDASRLAKNQSWHTMRSNTNSYIYIHGYMAMVVVYYISFLHMYGHLYSITWLGGRMPNTLCS